MQPPSATSQAADIRRNPQHHIQIGYFAVAQKDSLDDNVSIVVTSPPSYNSSTNNNQNVPHIVYEDEMPNRIHQPKDTMVEESLSVASAQPSISKDDNCISPVVSSADGHSEPISTTSPASSSTLQEQLTPDATTMS